MEQSGSFIEFLLSNVVLWMVGFALFILIVKSVVVIVNTILETNYFRDSENIDAQNKIMWWLIAFFTSSSLLFGLPHFFDFLLKVFL